MALLARLLFLYVFFCSSVHAGMCGDCAMKKHCKPRVCERCCDKMGGVQYCDSSAGRLVCNNGFYSSCYCTRHAIMDLQHIQGCCLWQGGVMTLDESTGYVICNNGAVSEVCSLKVPMQPVANW